MNTEEKYRIGECVMGISGSYGGYIGYDICVVKAASTHGGGYKLEKVGGKAEGTPINGRREPAFEQEIYSLLNLAIKRGIVLEKQRPIIEERNELIDRVIAFLSKLKK
jgi:hypothetical protein